MTVMIFAIVSFTSPNDPLATAIATTYPESQLQATPEGSLYFVSDSGTAKDVSDKIGVSAGTFGSVIVLAVSGYFGRAPMNIWEWIAAKITAPPKTSPTPITAPK
jgi:hypothetical protein